MQCQTIPIPTKKVRLFFIVSHSMVSFRFPPWGFPRLFLSPLVDLDAAVNLPDKEERREESNRAAEDKEHQTHDRRPSKVQDHTRERLDLQCREIVHDRVQEDVDRRSTTCEEGTPPPMVIFGTQVEIAHQDRHLGARQDQDAKHQEQEAKHIVDLVEPDRVQDEIELNEDRAKGQDTTDHHGGDRSQVEHLIWDLTRDLVGPDWGLNLATLES